MTTKPYNKPLPKIDPVNKPFWEHTRQHRLAMQTCERCGDMHFPPSPVCPQCLSSAQSWSVVSGNGVLLSWIEAHRAYWDGFKGELPYRVCLVRLDEGPMLISNLVGGAHEPAIGAALRVVFDDVTDEVTLPRFMPA